MRAFKRGASFIGQLPEVLRGSVPEASGVCTGNGEEQGAGQRVCTTSVQYCEGLDAEIVGYEPGGSVRNLRALQGVYAGRSATIPTAEEETYGCTEYLPVH